MDFRINGKGRRPIFSSDFGIREHLRSLEEATEGSEGSYLDSCVFFPFGNFDRETNISKQISLALNFNAKETLANTAEQLEAYAAGFEGFLARDDIHVTGVVREEMVYHLVTLKRKIRQIVMPWEIEKSLVEGITRTENAIVVNNMRYSERGVESDPLYERLFGYCKRSYDHEIPLGFNDMSVFLSALSETILDGKERTVVSNDSGIGRFANWVWHNVDSSEVKFEDIGDKEQLVGGVVHVRSVKRKSRGYEVQRLCSAHYEMFS